MPRFLKILLVIAAALLVLLVVLDPFDTSDPSGDDFDPETDGIVDVVLRDYNDGTLHFDCVGPNQTRRVVDEFISDPTEILHVAPGCFDSFVEDGEVQNRLVKVLLTDAEGNPAESTPAIDRIFEKAAQLNHSILKMYIFRMGEHHFPVIELNVNMWWPCGLYYYNQTSDRLIELYTYDATEITGLKIRNPGNISA